MIYILLPLAFSLFLLSSVEIGLYFNKKGRDEHFTLSIVYLKVIKINIKFPEMIFDVKNMIPFMTFKVNLSDINKMKTRKLSKKMVVSPVRVPLSHIWNFTKSLLQGSKRFKTVVKMLTKTIRIVKFNLKISFTSENPVFACITAGMMWSFTYIILSFVSHYFNFKGSERNIDIRPFFLHKESLQIIFEGIIQIRVGHIIIAGIVIPFIWFISQKGYFKTRRAKQYGWTSN